MSREVEVYIKILSYSYEEYALPILRYSIVSNVNHMEKQLISCFNEKTLDFMKCLLMCVE